MQTDKLLTHSHTRDSSTTQLLQTTEIMGDPYGPSPGTHLLRGNHFIGGSKATCMDCFKAFCLPCAIASAVQTATGTYDDVRQ